MWNKFFGKNKKRKKESVESGVVAFMVIFSGIFFMFFNF